MTNAVEQTACQDTMAFLQQFPHVVVRISKSLNMRADQKDFLALMMTFMASRMLSSGRTLSGLSNI